jgi:hypothetical protein
VERPGAVFATAPTEQDRPRHRWFGVAIGLLHPSPSPPYLGSKVF